MIPVAEAERLILNLVTPLKANLDQETLPLDRALGRIVAHPVRSQLDFPHWDNSAMDGYAVRHEDVRRCNRQNPITLEIIEEIPAGYQPQKTLEAGQTARIFTGAVLPQGADTIVIQENVQREGNHITLHSAPEFQDYVRHQGSFYRAGDILLEPGTRISAPEIAVLAGAQCSTLSVYRQPRIAIFSTGDELVTPDQPLKIGQIVDSNQYALTAFIQENGGFPLPLGIVRDNREDIKKVIEQALESTDVVLSTGGVSVGDYDYVEQILEELGGEILIRSVAIKPGKPLTVARFGKKLYFGIPGNPVSALVTCWRFILPALRKLSGWIGEYQPTFVKAKTVNDLRSDGKRESYQWGRLTLVKGNYQFHLAGGSQSSGNLVNLAQTNALAIVPVGQKFITAGDWVEAIKIRD